MVKTKIPVTNDYIFKKIFAKKGNENILKDFLIAVLEIPIKKVEVQAEISLEKQLEENKLGRLDLLAILNDTTIVNIEVQVLNPNNFIERTLYYWSGNYYNDLKAGENYRKIKRTIAINVLDYEQFEEGPFHEIVRLKRDYQNRILTDKMEIHFIQIPKFIKREGEIKTKLGQWMQFISQIDQKEVEVAMKENEAIKKANVEYEYLTGEEEERRIAFLRDKAIRDEKSIREGSKEEGREEGREEKQKEIAKKLLDKNMLIEEIIEITNLTKEEIEKLRKE
ncbi:MAG: Rpn family recombination-promoting nuclease/putative transposase [Clostridia bacterium]|nr:Rpn family recombination-promoting nuclease/putative transposase [Clostridia bacterium]